ncbi:DUF167 domain-containing protein [Hymenobacter sp. BT18]|nr:DUF167 domain-containing protein [Hymenobacter sp. BT18]
MAVLHLKAKPGARRTELLVGADGTVTVRLQAPAQDGKANECLLAFLAKLFAVPKSSVVLLAGHTAPYKKVQVTALTDEALRTTLAKHQA